VAAVAEYLTTAVGMEVTVGGCGSDGEWPLLLTAAFNQGLVAGLEARDLPAAVVLAAQQPPPVIFARQEMPAGAPQHL
jgi:hypothetical protein